MTVPRGGNPCYMTGTQIRTANGNRCIEDIAAGDVVVVVRNGTEVLEPVKWTGYSSVNLATHAHVEDAAPICIRKDAIAPDQPLRDLLVSPEHCMIINDRCVPAKLLVNGGSIIRQYHAGAFRYHHLELERHGILIAEGAYAESYLDTGNRSMFDTADGPTTLHPTFVVNALADRWKTDACAPLACMEHEVAPIWQMLADRSAALGFVAPQPDVVEDADVHVMVDGQRIQPVSDRGGRYVFIVPAGAASVSLASRCYIPADEMIATVRDTRRLGVRVDWLAIRWGNDEMILSADNPALEQGWHDAEADAAASWRWTDGSATIPWENVSGSAVLTVRCSPAKRYPAAQQMVPHAA